MMVRISDKQGLNWLARAILCIFAISLLWLTTLKVSVAILSQFFDLPRLETVWAVCESTYDDIQVQKRAHAACSDRQMQVCTAQLDASVASQISIASEAKRANDALIECMRSTANSCSAALNDIRSEVAAIERNYVGTWSKAFENSCSNSSRSALSAYFADSSETDAGVMAAVNQLSFASSENIATIARFADDLNDYNVDYASNKTLGIQRAVASIQADMEHLSSEAVTDIEHLMASVLTSTEQLIACIGLDNATVVRSHCPQGLGMYDRMKELQYMMRVHTLIFEGFVDDYKREFDMFAADVTDAIKSADNFYDSITGASGLISWIVKNLNVFQVANELCGKGSPNWCDFSKASWYVYIPDAPPDISPLLVDFPDLGVLWDPYATELSDFRKNLQLDQLKMKAVPISLNSKLGVHIGNLPGLKLSVDGIGPEDYHPPKYSNYATDDPSKQKSANESESILGQSSRSYDELRYNMTKSIEARLTQSIEYLNGWNATDIINANPAVERVVESISGKVIELSDFKFSTASFTFPTIEPEMVFGKLDSFLEILYLFDNLYRLWLSFRIFYLYWTNAVIGVSMIDASDVDDTYVQIEDPTACQYELHKSMTLKVRNSSSPSPPPRHCPAYTDTSRSHRRNLAVDAFLQPKEFYSSYVEPSRNRNELADRVDSQNESSKMTSATPTASDAMSPYSWGNAGLTVWKLILYFVSHFWVQIGIVIGFSGIVGYTLYALYIPLYQDYVANCVSHTSSEGTFLTKNLYAAGFNFARSSGDARLATTIAEYNAKASGICSQNRGVSEKSFRNHSNFMESLASTHQEQFNRAHEFQSCINESFLDAAYMGICGENTCPLNPRTSLPFKSIESYVNSSYCNTNFTKGSLLELSTLCDADFSYLQWEDETDRLTPSRASVFNCSAIPKCETTCSGPDPIVLRAQTEQCSCMMEWAFHAGLLYFAMALGIYALINISRLLFNKALIQIFMFRVQVNPRYRTIVCTNALGHVMVPEVRVRPKESSGSSQKQEFSGYYVSQDSHRSYSSDVFFKDNPIAPKSSSSRRPDYDAEIGRKVPAMEEVDVRDFLTPDSILRFVISSKISDLESRVETFGLLYLIASVLVHIPWILMVIILKDSLAYQPV